MHFCKAKILIGGDTRNIMTRTEYHPVSWPEVEVIETVHGIGSVEDVEPFVFVEQRPKVERERLASIYGEQPLQEIWGGRNAPGEMDAPKVASLPSDVVWFNPLTHAMEISGKDGNGSRPLPPPASPPAGSIETRPAVEVVGQPVVSAHEPNDPFSEYDQPEETAPAELAPVPVAEPAETAETAKPRKR
jgi:hypothetical protein